MRRPLAIVGGVVALSLVATGARAHGGPAPRRARQTVTVHVTCGGAPDAASSVSPDPVELVQGDEVDWALSDSSNVDAFTIVPADVPGAMSARAWPFALADGRHRGARGTPAAGRRMRANAAGRYRYAVVARCGGGAGGAGTEVSIDPDLIIRAQ